MNIDKYGYEYMPVRTAEEEEALIKEWASMGGDDDIADHQKDLDRLDAAARVWLMEVRSWAHHRYGQERTKEVVEITGHLLSKVSK